MLTMVAAASIVRYPPVNFFCLVMLWWWLILCISLGHYLTCTKEITWLAIVSQTNLNMFEWLNEMDSGWIERQMILTTTMHLDLKIWRYTLNKKVCLLPVIYSFWFKNVWDYLFMYLIDFMWWTWPNIDYVLIHVTSEAYNYNFFLLTLHNEGLKRMYQYSWKEKIIW